MFFVFFVSVLFYLVCFSPFWLCFFSCLLFVSGGVGLLAGFLVVFVDFCFSCLLVFWGVVSGVAVV